MIRARPGFSLTAAAADYRLVAWVFLRGLALVYGIAFVSLAVLAALVPYSIGMHLNDYRPYAYSGWQSTNWVWTIGQAIEGDLDDGNRIAITVVAAVMLLGCVLAAGKLTLPRRIATPARVLEELEAAKRSS